LKTTNPYIFFCDVETTGFSPLYNDVIQVACIVADKDLNIIDTFDGGIRPTSRKNWTMKSQEVHGITFNEALRFPPGKKVAIDLLWFLNRFKADDNQPLLFVAHEYHGFDFKFFENIFRRENLDNSFRKVFNYNCRESTLEMADKYKKVTGLDKSKLNILAEYFNIYLDHHSAVSDVNACYEVYKNFKNMKFGLGI